VGNGDGDGRMERVGEVVGDAVERRGRMKVMRSRSENLIAEGCTARKRDCGSV
jgi:hypothetical protein